MASRRFEYVLDLNVFLAKNRYMQEQGALVRGDLSFDPQAVAELMIDAYKGTIDYDGESLQDAIDEVQSYLEEDHVQPMLSCSWLYLVQGQLASACLVGLWGSDKKPLIAYILTGPKWKGRGYADLVLKASLECLREEGLQEVHAFITEGNTPSEKLFLKNGFSKVVAEEAVKADDRGEPS